MLKRKKGTYTILSNRCIADHIYELVLDGYTGFITAPGQFVNIALPGFFLRRPISISDYDSYSITLVYKCVGHGTKTLSEMRAGEKLDVLTGLGNGYHIEEGINHPLLIGGGAGIPPPLRLGQGAQPQAHRLHGASWVQYRERRVLL